MKIDEITKIKTTKEVVAKAIAKRDDEWINKIEMCHMNVGFKPQCWGSEQCGYGDRYLSSPLQTCGPCDYGEWQVVKREMGYAG